MLVYDVLKRLYSGGIFTTINNTENISIVEYPLSLHPHGDLMKIEIVRIKY